MPNATNIERKDCPPCQSACPILTDAREYIQLIAERKFDEAFASIRRLNPLPGVCGRICTHPCEQACKRGQVDEPLAISALKRFASDGPWAAEYKPGSPEKSSEEKVAIVGSGPAGLAAAHDLALLGHQVTIFEALPVLGGMLRVGVPEYRLPKDELEKEIQAILSLGVEVKTGIRIGEDMKLADLFDQGYKAVFVAVGAHEDRKLGIDGENTLEGVVSAVSFLGQVNQKQDPKVGTKVAVVGGGNTAVDSARSALRLGTREVHMVYRRSQDEMPAAREEIEEAIHEGVQMAYLTSPVEILGQDGKVSALKCVRNELGEPDASGRRRPTPVQGSEFTLDVDMVIAAIGQAPETSFLSSEPGLAEGGTRIVTKDPDALATPLAGVFAGGDAVTGPATAIKAIAAGKRVAGSIDLYLKGQNKSVPAAIEERESPKLDSGVVEKTGRFSRCSDTSLPIDTRLKGFDEVVSVLSEDLATREALRCLHCYLGAKIDQDKCISCLTCVRVCPLLIPQTGKMGEIT
ncbi:MAG: FAD-dependent oxidoreductase, partial [Deltaproteobacteria bacterium]|nr:FAD-dependent oxidoreductase [Deltaproteobacteria bacterium]